MEKDRDKDIRGIGWEDIVLGLQMLDAKQWVHKIIANEFDLEPSCHYTLGVNNADMAQGKINL